MLRRILLSTATIVALAPWSAQAGPLDGLFNGIFDVDTADELTTTGVEFQNSAYGRYLDLTAAIDSGFDNRDAEIFHHKARHDARRIIAIPEEPVDRDLTAEETETFYQALGRLRRGFYAGGRETHADAMAKAQVAYDCWIEATEDGDSETAEICRDAFEGNMAEVEGPAEEVEVAAASAVAALPPTEYLVYFEFDSTTLTPAGEAVLQEAIADLTAHPEAVSRLIGHADTTGAAAYNVELSRRRAEAVTARMLDAGIAEERISAEWVGEAQPLIPTPDETYEPGNRVVEVKLM